MRAVRSRNNESDVPFSGCQGQLQALHGITPVGRAKRRLDEKGPQSLAELVGGFQCANPC